jgi:hypothetical protein
MKVTYEDEVIPFTIESTYRPDYRISIKDGKSTTYAYVEFKGGGRAFVPEVRRKMIAVRDQHPDKKFFIVFYSDFKIGPKRKDGSFLRASDWAMRNKYDFCIGTENIPQEWFDPSFKGSKRFPKLIEEEEENDSD